MIQRFQKNITFAYTYQLTKFGGLMSCVWFNEFGGLMSYLNMHLVSCTNTHHNVTDLVNRGMAKTTKI